MPIFRKHSGFTCSLILLSALAVTGCPPHPVAPAKPKGGLDLVVKPPQARIYVDEQLAGDGSTYAGRPLLLAPGVHRVKIVAEGFYPEYLEVEVGDELIRVDVSLTAIPPPLGVDLP